MDNNTNDPGRNANNDDEFHKWDVESELPIDPRSAREPPGLIQNEPYGQYHWDPEDPPQGDVLSQKETIHDGDLTEKDIKDPNVIVWDGPHDPVRSNHSHPTYTSSVSSSHTVWNELGQSQKHSDLEKMHDHHGLGINDIYRILRLVRIQFRHSRDVKKVRRLNRGHDNRDQSVRARIRVRADYFRTYVGTLWTEDTIIRRLLYLCYIPDSRGCCSECGDYNALSVLWGFFWECSFGDCRWICHTFSVNKYFY